MASRCRALAAGLSGAVAASRLIVTAGLAEVVAGSIAMGLGGYLAARSEAEHYASEVRRERREIAEQPEVELAEVREVFERFGLTREESARVARSLGDPRRVASPLRAGSSLPANGLPTGVRLPRDRGQRAAPAGAAMSGQ